MDARDVAHLNRCVELAEEALRQGNPPFGSILVSGDGPVLYEDYNRTAGGDATRHPELAISEWAVRHLDPGARAAATVYTSTEHCPMCAAAHAWVGLGRIVYAASAEQLAGWMAAWDADPAPVAMLPIRMVVPDAVVEGPCPGLADRVRDLHGRRLGARRTKGT